MSSLLVRVRKNAVLQNTFYLYIVRIAGMLVPLMLTPILARRLGPGIFGAIVFGQALGAWLSILVEFGSAYNASRAIAKTRDDLQQMRLNVGIFQSLKIAMLLVSLAILVVVIMASDTVKAAPQVIVPIALSLIVQAFGPLWFFQGIERIRDYAVFDLGSRIFILIASFLLIHSTSDGWKYSTLQLIGSTVTAVWATLFMTRRVGFKFAPIRSIWLGLIDAFPLLLFRFGSNLYMAINSMIIGWTLPMYAAGLYGGGERIFRAGTSLISPVSDALYPRLNYLRSNNYILYKRWMRLSALVICSIGIIICAALETFAPLLVSILLGPEYPDAVRLVRIFAIATPAIALGTVAGVQGLLSNGRDKTFTSIVVSAGVINVSVGVFWLSRFGIEALCWSVVIAEWFVALACVAAWFFGRRSGRENG